MRQRRSTGLDYSSQITAEIWHGLFSATLGRLDILVYAGGFLLETLDLADVIRAKSDSGVSVRVLIGDPASDAVQVRSLEQGIPWLPERCRTTARYLAEVGCAAGVTICAHGTTLQASLYRFDDTVLVNAHTFGSWACQSPVYLVRRHRSSGLFDYYDRAFQRVWDAVATAQLLAPRPGSMPRLGRALAVSWQQAPVHSM